MPTSANSHNKYKPGNETKEPQLKTKENEKWENIKKAKSKSKTKLQSYQRWEKYAKK